MCASITTCEPGGFRCIRTLENRRACEQLGTAYSVPSAVNSRKTRSPSSPRGQSGLSQFFRPAAKFGGASFSRPLSHRSARGESQSVAMLSNHLELAWVAQNLDSSASSDWSQDKLSPETGFVYILEVHAHRQRLFAVRLLKKVPQIANFATVRPSFEGEFRIERPGLAGVYGRDPNGHKPFHVVPREFA
jgi:hypothetical protein